MPNPYLPNWEYIPDGEPRVFNDRVYIYGSHDSPNSDKFCDYRLKVWSAPINDLSNWVCHGDIFCTRDNDNHHADTSWTNNELYAPDVIEKDGKYYLYAYIMGAIGCVAVSDSPYGKFKLLSKYKYSFPKGSVGECGWFIDPSVFVDDDGKVYIYCGFEKSFVAEINPNNMYEVLDGTYQEDIIPTNKPFNFFEACSVRKIKDTYYMIYSKKGTGALVYATSKYPNKDFKYQGVIIDNGIDYFGGNNHGSICNINNQWYIFYHKMTNNTIMSRRGCVEKIQILEDGSIPQVEMTSLGFQDSLSPYSITNFDIACVLKGGCFINEKNIFTRVISNIKSGCIIGFKYFDFGEDISSKVMNFHADIIGLGAKGEIHILLDDYENGTEIGICEFSTDSGIVSTKVKAVTGFHAVYFKINDTYGGYFTDMFKDRCLLELKSFVFTK